jgi:DNA-binding MarR family transcriptional regulator
MRCIRRIVKRTLPQPGPRYPALLQVLRTAETLWNSSRLFFARWNLSPSQFNLLNLLRDQPAGSTQVDLSRTLIMHRSNVTGLVDRLEARGLVRRQEDAADRRSWRVQLTPEGSRLIQEILPHFYAAAEETWGRVPIGQVRQVVSQLEQLAANAERIAVRTDESNPPKP